MEQSIFPVDVPDFTDERNEYDRRYKRSVKWDAEKGDFARDSAKRMVECDGKESFFQWCFKIAQTERYRCLAYPDCIGTEMERAMEDDDEKTVESMVQRTVTDALMVNPRTEYVGDFEFTWENDRMHCAFFVKGIDIDDAVRVLLS